MRNNRSALWALGLAGAALLWKNRDKLQQLGGGQRTPQPLQLPDGRKNNDWQHDQQPAEEQVGSQASTNGPFGRSQV